MRVILYNGKFKPTYFLFTPVSIFVTTELYNEKKVRDMDRKKPLCKSSWICRKHLKILTTRETGISWERWTWCCSYDCWPKFWELPGPCIYFCGICTAKNATLMTLSFKKIHQNSQLSQLMRLAIIWEWSMTMRSVNSIARISIRPMNLLL